MYCAGNGRLAPVLPTVVEKASEFNCNRLAEPAKSDASSRLFQIAFFEDIIA